MKILHDTRNSFHREPGGPLSCKEPIILRLETDPEFSGTMTVRIWAEDRERLLGMKRVSETFFEASFVMPSVAGQVWYHFIIEEEIGVFYMGNSEKRRGGQGVLYQTTPPSFQITVSDRFAVPGWAQNRILYQIFPDSFCNGNPSGRINSPKKGTTLHASWENKPSYHKDKEGRIVQWSFFGGNMAGITSKLDYLASLGVGALYLNPIFEAASPHRYDTGDYLKIDGVLGTLDDFDQLILEAKKRDMAIILDGVFNHTGANSRYFNKQGTYDTVGAFNSKDSPYYNWYSFIRYPDTYDCWWGVDDLPNVNETLSSYREFIYEGENSVIRYWMRRGVMGFRLDVADELPEDFIRGIRKTMMEENPEALLIGEVWEDASNKVSYGKMRNYFGGDQLHSVMNYPLYEALIDFINGKIDSIELGEILLSLYENYPKGAVLCAMNLIGSHDRPRVLTLLSQEDPGAGVKKLKMLSAIQMSLPGMATIYYGDEAGMEGGPDPENRGPFPWGRENPDILSWYLAITNVRREALQELLFELPVLAFPSADQIVFSLTGDRKRAHVLVNRGLLPGDFWIPGGEAASELLYGGALGVPSEEGFQVTVPAQTTFIVLVTLSRKDG